MNRCEMPLKSSGAEKTTRFIPSTIADCVDEEFSAGEFMRVIFRCSFLIALAISFSVSIRAAEQDFVFTLVSPSHTVTLRMKVELDRRPLADVLQPRFEALFVHLDRDGNHQLDADELRASPSAGWLRRVAWGYLPANHSEWIRLSEADTDRDDSVSLAEMQAWFSQHGIGEITCVAAHSSITPVLTDALWRHLDVDHDRRLSFAELAASLELLRKLDEDDDELVSGREVASSVAQPYPFPTVRLTKPRFEVAAHPDPHTKIDIPVFAQLSLNQTIAEIAPFPPNTVSVGQSKLTDAPEWSVGISHLVNRIPFSFGDCTYVVRAARGSSRRWKEEVESLARSHFMAADLDHDHVVTTDEAAKATNRSVVTIFDFADGNGDQRITSDEWQTSLDVLGPLTEANVQLTLLAHQHSLFELVDANRDGFLSRAELRVTSTTLPAGITRDDLPTAITIVLSLGQPNFPLSSSSSASSSWYTAMDRNHDGTVSRLELIGERRVFEMLDRDKDGAISPSESLATSSELHELDRNQAGRISPRSDDQ